MSDPQDFLFEIGTEELPPKSLQVLVFSLKTLIVESLHEAALHFEDIITYATPRRLAIKIQNLVRTQADSDIEKRGPALKAAYDTEGQPTKALLSFAQSCHVDVAELTVHETDKGAWLMYRGRQKGQSVEALLPDMIDRALKKCPIPKPMRWSNKTFEFIRPVQWVLMLFGSDVIRTTLMGCQSDRLTRGHRFHHPDTISIAHPDEYESKLEAAYVIASFGKRRELIKQKVSKLGNVIMEPDLLDEVTAIVEWPVPLMARFEKEFLKIPHEALIAEMRDHQKYFHVEDEQGNLLPNFVTVSNLDSPKPERVIHGNERVMRARLSDAAFFYEQDLKMPLENHFDTLSKITFQAKLGSLADKSNRVSDMAAFLAQELNIDVASTRRASQLAKCDLATNMVQEFPELEGIMGAYYAQNDGEKTEVAIAIREHYLPRFSKDTLPQTTVGKILALAERFDTLVGIFSINEKPTGMKDPFKCRRSALGIVRIILDNAFPLSLKACLETSLKTYPSLENQTVIEDVKQFILERARAWYLEEGVPPDVFQAVLVREDDILADMEKRIQALLQFRALEAADALAAANKRVSNLLKKESIDTTTLRFDAALISEQAESDLATVLAQKTEEIRPLCESANYTQALTQLADLRQPVDRFFDEVMVMVEDPIIRNNRLALLSNLRQQFLQIADISMLQPK